MEPMEDETVEVPCQFINNVLAEYSNNGERILMFCSQETKQLIGEMKEFFIDGSFKTCPEPFTQLYSIHGELNSATGFAHVIPLIYVFISNTEEESYNIVFQILKGRLPQFAPVRVYCNLELATTRALLKSYPEVNISLCYYHWTKSIREIGKLHNHTHYPERRIVALCAVLPLLPRPALLKGWDYIKHFRVVLYMTKFLTHIEKFWLYEHLEDLSVFGKPYRTSNPFVGWHKKLNREINKENVSMPHLLNVLIKFENVQIQKGLKQVKRKKREISDEANVRQVQMELIKGEIVIGHALEQLRH